MRQNFTGGKRQREAQRDRRKKEKQARLEYNRSQRAQGLGDASMIATAPEQLPDVKLEDVVISVAAQPRRDTVGPVKLFVGGLSWDTGTEGLHQAFAKFGKIDDAIVILDRTTGRSRGFGFVTFERAVDATEAIKAMNGHELDGHTLKVNRAEAR
jgi:RNA recognition motif-containing protein